MIFHIEDPCDHLFMVILYQFNYWLKSFPLKPQYSCYVVMCAMISQNRTHLDKCKFIGNICNAYQYPKASQSFLSLQKGYVAVYDSEVPRGF